MTELYFMDENFRLIEGPVEDMTSVVWSERYFEPGTFTFHFPREAVKRIAGASYVRSGKNAAGDVFCGRIEYLRADTDGDCEMGGHMLECLLDDRVTYGDSQWTGTVTDAVLEAVTENLRGSPVNIGAEHASIPDEVTLTSAWEPLSDWVYATLRPYGASCRVTLDENDIPTFTIVKGADLSTDACDQPVIFSASFGNIFSIEMEEDTREMKNVAYVEGSDGTIACADLSDGGGKREIYKKAGDIRPDDFQTDDAYRAALTRRGREILAKYSADVNVTAEIDADALPVYGTDYRIGDVCDVVDEELGIRRAMRLTRVDWVAENGRVAVYPGFGE